MLESTKKRYLDRAESFLISRMEESFKLEELAHSLQRASYDYRPAYWCELRIGLSLLLKENGYLEAANRITQCQNICPPGQRKKKMRRLRKVNDEDEKRLIEHLENKGDDLAVCAIQLVKYTGARPCELNKILWEKHRFTISGAKKSEKLQRGLDRTIALDNGEDTFKNFCDFVLSQMEISARDDKEIRAIQRRIYRASRAIFPRRKTHYSLYSWRHQFGSNLRASGLSAVEVAYIMGHQSTASVRQYGHRRSSNGFLKVRAVPSMEAMSSLVREKPVGDFISAKILANSSAPLSEG
ncbi:site-specific integrase [Parendozoicomonas haliclonae]|uniref:Phage integrase family protein n=1 Tax=Parendozoicomonas haliclonae TaxID=1960125 RepID=A0A1X7AIE5_9GAMM|nr:site-specific integrase [Parendozoicomonas haliclonae]SMA45128.1 Phage integrase family protein [Parendozoicomonas haliclonae]